MCFSRLPPAACSPTKVTILSYLWTKQRTIESDKSWKRKRRAPKMIAIRLVDSSASVRNLSIRNTWWEILCRRLGSESDQEILMVPVCVILSLGVWTSISPPGPPPPLAAHGSVLAFVSRNQMKSSSVRSWWIHEGCWMISGGYE